MIGQLALDIVERYRPFNLKDWSDHRIYMVLVFAYENCGLALELLLISEQSLFISEMNAILENYSAEDGAFKGGYWPRHAALCGCGCQPTG